MNANSGQQLTKSQSSPMDKSTLPQNCEFMKYLQPSKEALPDQQQNADEYEDIYKTLSSGVYESSDAFEPQQQHELQEEKAEEHHKSDVIMIEQKVDFRSSLREEHKSTYQNMATNEPAYEGIQMEEQALKQYEKDQEATQNVRKSNIQQNQTEQREPPPQQIEEKEQSSKVQYPSLQASQQQAQNQQKDQPQVSLRKEEQVQIMQDESVPQTPLQSSIHICVEESFTLPQEQQQMKQFQRMEEKSALKRQQIRSQPIENKAVPFKLQFKSVQVNIEKFYNHDEHNGTKISITGYEQQYFLKIETQIFRIDVHRKDKQYVIKRRFSEFATLQKLIRHHYPGYILYPFPQKSLQFFKRLKLSIGSEQQKITMIQKRLFQLEKYVNFLLSHREISSSIILEIFLQQSTQTFQRQTGNLLSISLEQQKELQLGVIQQNYNSIKKLMKSGLSFFNNYLTSSPTNSTLETNLKALQEASKKNSELFATIRIQLEQCTQKLSNFSTNIERLASIYKYNSEIQNIESSIDSVLKLSSKMSSSKAFSEKYSEWIEDNLIYHIRYYDLLFITINQSIGYRTQLLSKMDSLTVEHYHIAEKVEEKIQLFDDRFVDDWSNIMRELDHNLAILYEKFNAEWKIHCRLMSQIWK